MKERFSISYTTRDKDRWSGRWMPPPEPAPVVDPRLADEDAFMLAAHHPVPDDDAPLTAEERGLLSML